MGRWGTGEIDVGQSTQLKLCRMNKSRDPMYSMKTLMIVNIIVLNTGNFAESRFQVPLSPKNGNYMGRRCVN